MPNAAEIKERMRVHRKIFRRDHGKKGSVATRQRLPPGFLKWNRAESIFFCGIFLVNSRHGRRPAAAHRQHALPRGHADR
jgi:hypothetical protein